MATVNLYLDVTHPKQDGTCSLKFIFRNKGTSAGLATGYCLPPECWNGNKVVSCRGKQLPSSPALLNHEIQAELAKVTLALKDITGKKGNMSASTIKAKIALFLRGAAVATNTDHTTLVGVYEEYLTEMKTHNSRRTITSSLNFIKKNIRRANSIQLDDIDEQWAEELKKMMIHGTKNNKPLGNNTVTHYLNFLNCVWGYAYRKGYTMEIKSPFAGKKMPYQPSKSRAISIEQLRELWAMEPKNKSRAMALDIFRLSFMLCGLNPIDMFRLKDSDVRIGRINILRQKTGVPINILILPEAQKIFDRYKSGKWMLGRVISPKDQLNDFNNNLTLRRVDRALGQLLPGLTMYYARHSWMSIGVELDIPDRTLFMGIAHKQGKNSDETYITMRHHKLDLANRKILDYVLQQGEFACDKGVTIK